MNHTNWRPRLEAMVSTLKGLTTPEFFNEDTLEYHSVERDIFALTQAFDIDRGKLEPLLATKPVARECWLPLNPDRIRTMDVAEVYWRLRENLADERFWDGALEEPFESGSLIAALLRIRGDLDGLIVLRD